MWWLSSLACSPPPAPATCGIPSEPLVSVPPDAPLSRIVSVQTDRPCTIQVEWDDGARIRATRSETGTEHTLLLAGMRADTEVLFTLSEVDEHQRTLPLVTRSFRTAALPDFFPDIVAHRSEPDQLEPGDTLVSFGNDTSGYQAVIDAQGDVIWLLSYPRLLFLEPDTEDGLLGVHMDGTILEIDWAGRQRDTWPGQWAGGDRVDVAWFHHEVQRLPDDSLLALGADLQTVADFPLSYDDPLPRAEAEVLVDEVVRFMPDGTLLSRIPLSELLPTDRIGYGSLDEALGGADWSHANAITVDPTDGDWIVSLRHQDAIVEIDPDAERIDWVLANPANWPDPLDELRLIPEGDVVWPYHQHGPEMLDDGTLLLFDNGDDRASPWTEEPRLDASETWSQISAFSIDERQKTVQMRWSFEIPGVRLWSGACGDVDEMPQTGNILSLWGYISHIDGIAQSALGKGAFSERLVEFDPDSGEVLLDIEIASAAEDNSYGWHGYRAERIPAL